MRHPDRRAQAFVVLNVDRFHKPLGDYELPTQLFRQEKLHRVNASEFTICENGLTEGEVKDLLHLLSETKRRSIKTPINRPA
jgi:hypothetical protein